MQVIDLSLDREESNRKSQFQFLIATHGRDEKWLQYFGWKT
jgi:hypothetical protein